MRYRKVTQLAIHLLGIYVTLTAIPDLLRFLAAAFDPELPRTFAWLFLYPAISGLRIAIGVYLACWGGILLDSILPPARVYCADCGLNRGRRAVAGPCPDCGFVERQAQTTGANNESE